MQRTVDDMTKYQEETFWPTVRSTFVEAPMYFYDLFRAFRSYYAHEREAHTPDDLWGFMGEYTYSKDWELARMAVAVRIVDLLGVVDD